MTETSAFKKLSESKLMKLLRYYEAGYSLRAIGKLMAVSRSTVTHHLKKAGVKIRSKDDYFKPREGK